MNLPPKLKVKNTIGEGLNAFVYEAELKDRSLKISKKVAFKVLKRKEDIKHFKKELSNLMQVSGKRLVKCFGWRKYKGYPGLILEFVDGLSLFEVNKSLSLSLNEKKWILSEVHKGISELQDCGLFHGDLSPKNILISKSGQVKLIDFGMTTWRTKLVEATPGFISPLILSGGEPSYKTDLDSFKALEKYMDLDEGFSFHDKIGSEVQQSLSFKISNLNLNIETVSFVDAPSVAYKRLETGAVNFSFFTNSMYYLLFSLSLFLLITPARLSFSRRDSGFFVRSQNWMAVKKSATSSWCYTPCKLTYNNTGKKKVFFKSSLRTGEKEFELNQVGFLELDQSDFY